MLNSFQLRKNVFDYLKANLSNVEIVPEHPTGTNVINPKIVVQYIRDSAAGLYISENIENPEIQITAYANKELELTKPLGLIQNIINLMKNYECGCNFHLIKNIPVGYVPDTVSYASYLIYRFYTGE